MLCPRGSLCTESEHEVKTLAKARDWYEGVVEADLPITVQQFKAANGRRLLKIYNRENRKIHQRG